MTAVIGTVSCECILLKSLGRGNLVFKDQKHVHSQHAIHACPT